MARGDERGRDQSWSAGRGPQDGMQDSGGRRPGGSRPAAPYDRDRAGYGGQEYGMDGGHPTTSDLDPAWRGDEREVHARDRWRPGHGEPYGELELNPRDRGVREFGPPADYAYHPPAGHELDPDYLQWREARMRRHDSDYREWRAQRVARYDEAYRRSRGGRH